MSTGMIIDGVFASQAVDSSGEVLDIAGCDISSLDVDGVANYEHKEGDKKGTANNGEEIVGRIIYAKKVMSAGDCDTAREKKYWEQVKVPFIYGMVRLYDGAGHAGAQALAAQIRDHHANNEPILVRYSIEGSTLDRDPNDRMRLKESVARRVALTLKPCNRTCASGLIEDPRAPAGFEKKPADEEPVADLLAGLVEKGETPEHPAYTKLGGVHELECSPLCPDDDLAKLKLVVKGKMLKAITAGSYGVAPGSLEGGAALQREHLRSRLKRAVTEFQPKDGRFDRVEFKAFAKTYLPEVDDAYLDHFSEVAEDYHAKRLNKAELAKVAKPAQKKPERYAAVKAFAAKGVAERKVKPKLAAPAVSEEPLSIQGKPAKVTSVDAPVFDEKKGVLHTPRGSFPMYIPSRDKQKGAKESFEHILHDPHVNKFHDYAMENWARVHKMLKAGTLPPEVVMHATLFSQLSPNTPVPMQELMYGHLVDSMKHTGTDARSPGFDEAVRQDWLSRDRPDKLPQHSPEHWERISRGIRLKNPSFYSRDEHGKKILRRGAGQLASFMLANNKFDSMAKYHMLHDQLVNLVNTHKANARAGVAELMEHKRQAKLWEAMRARAAEAGKPDPGPYTKGPDVTGLAPKTARYAYGMMGGGNVVVPDTHFVRYLFGLDKKKDAPSIEHIKNILWNENNTRLLDAIDRYYAQHHDAVKHMLAHPKWKGVFDNPEDAVFPAFWKNWVAIMPHERARGFGNYEGFNEYTDHRPYWEAVDPLLKSEEVSDFSLPARTAMLHSKWVRDYGEMPALAMYYVHLVPKLLQHHVANEVESTVRKIEGLLVDLKKAEADDDAARAASQPREDPVMFAGLRVLPGCAQTAHGRYALLHEGEDGYVGVPESKLPGWDVEDLVRLPRAQQGTHYLVTRRPAVPVGELENK